jgi:alpha-L-fucosidase
VVFRHSLIIIFVCIKFCGKCTKRLSTETDEPKKQRLAWWISDRFGMFVHWGLYSFLHGMNEENNVKDNQ